MITMECVYCAVRTASLNILIQVNRVFRELTYRFLLKLELRVLYVKYSNFCRIKSCFSYWYEICLPLVQPLYSVCHSYIGLHLVSHTASPASVTLLPPAPQLQNTRSLSFPTWGIKEKPLTSLIRVYSKRGETDASLFSPYTSLY